MAVSETVYLDHDNTVDLLLKADSGTGATAQDLSAVTRMVLELDDSTTVDSEEDGDAFNWNTGTTGKVILDLGVQDLTEGYYQARLVVYDASNTNGIVWADFTLKVCN